MAQWALTLRSIFTAHCSPILRTALAKGCVVLLDWIQEGLGGQCLELFGVSQCDAGVGILLCPPVGTFHRKNSKFAALSHRNHNLFKKIWVPKIARKDSVQRSAEARIKATWIGLSEILHDLLTLVSNLIKGQNKPSNDLRIYYMAYCIVYYYISSTHQCSLISVINIWQEPLRKVQSSKMFKVGTWHSDSVIRCFYSTSSLQNSILRLRRACLRLQRDCSDQDGSANPKTHNGGFFVGKCSLNQTFAAPAKELLERKSSVNHQSDLHLSSLSLSIESGFIYHLSYHSLIIFISYHIISSKSVTTHCMYTKGLDA